MKIESKIEITGIHKFIFRDAKTGKILRQKVYKNLIMNVGKNMVANRLAGTGNSCDITYGAVGTSAAAPAADDTTLGTELDRVAVTAISASGSIVNVVCFFGASDGNGTLTEFGHFGEAATGAADSGTILNHVVISETKTSAETLTIESSITIA